jgi:hypothetical protein
MRDRSGQLGRKVPRATRERKDRQDRQDLPGPQGAAAVAQGARLRVVVGQEKAACGLDEVMIGAYCTGDNATLRMDGMTGVVCQDANATAVVSCATK